MTGAGTASFAAYRAIKSKDPTAKILIVGDENRLAYKIKITLWLILTSTVWFILTLVLLLILDITGCPTSGLTLILISILNIDLDITGCPTCGLLSARSSGSMRTKQLWRSSGQISSNPVAK